MCKRRVKESFFVFTFVVVFGMTPLSFADQTSIGENPNKPLTQEIKDETVDVSQTIKNGSSGKCRDKRFQLSEQAGRSDASRMGPVWFVGDATAKSGIEKSSPRQYISCWFPNQSTKGDWPWRRQVICTTLWG